MENKPKKKFCAGLIRASIWENEVDIGNGDKRNIPKVSVERRYKTPQGDWRSSNRFGINELAKLQAVVRAAFDYLVLGDKDDDRDEVKCGWLDKHFEDGNIPDATTSG